ncbi:MAG: hypothetical protein ACHQ3P_09435 [Candidatus Limnocylindrales bacterium]
MKYGAGPAIPPTSDTGASFHQEWACDVDGASLSALEELQDARPLLGRAGSDRVIGLVVAACAALVCFGFAGRIWTSDAPAADIAVEASPTISAAPAIGEAASIDFALDEPVDGTVVTGGRVLVRGVADPGVDQVHVAIYLGSAVLGWANLDVAAHGVVDADVRLFEPSFDVPLAVVISGHSPGEQAFEIRRTIEVRAAGPVTVWQCDVAPTAAGALRYLVVDGSALSSIGELSIEVASPGAKHVVTATAANGRDDYRPGSVGGALIGRGSFRARIALPGPVPKGGWTVRISWIDPASRARRGVVEVISPTDEGDRE